MTNEYKPPTFRQWIWAKRPHLKAAWKRASPSDKAAWKYAMPGLLIAIPGSLTAGIFIGPWTLALLFGGLIEFGMGMAYAKYIYDELE